MSSRAKQNCRYSAILRSQGTLCPHHDCHPERSRGTLCLLHDCHPERSRGTLCLLHDTNSRHEIRAPRQPQIARPHTALPAAAPEAQAHWKL